MLLCGFPPPVAMLGAVVSPALPTVVSDDRGICALLAVPSLPFVGMLWMWEGSSAVVRVCVSRPPLSASALALVVPVLLPTPIGARPRRSGKVKCDPSTAPNVVPMTVNNAAYVERETLEPSQSK